MLNVDFPPWIFIDKLIVRDNEKAAETRTNSWERGEIMGGEKMKTKTIEIDSHHEFIVELVSDHQFYDNHHFN